MPGDFPTDNWPAWLTAVLTITSTYLGTASSRLQSQWQLHVCTARHGETTLSLTTAVLPRVYGRTTLSSGPHWTQSLATNPCYTNSRVWFYFNSTFGGFAAFVVRQTCFERHVDIGQQSTLSTARLLVETWRTRSTKHSLNSTLGTHRHVLCSRLLVCWP